MFFNEAKFGRNKKGKKGGGKIKEDLRGDGAGEMFLDDEEINRRMTDRRSGDEHTERNRCR